MPSIASRTPTAPRIRGACGRSSPVGRASSAPTSSMRCSSAATRSTSSTTSPRASGSNVADGAELHVADIRDPDAVFDAARPEVVVHLAAQADVRVSVERPDVRRGRERDRDGADPRGGPAARRPDRLRVDRRRDLRRVRRARAGVGGAAAARPVRDVEALRRGVPRDVEPPPTARTTSRFASATSTARGRSRTARPASSRSSWASCSDGGTPKIYGDGEPDARLRLTSATSCAPSSPRSSRDGGVFNVGTGIETSVLDLYDAIRRATGVEREPEHAPARLGELQRSVLDVSPAERELGWRPEHPLDAGLARPGGGLQE